jgi:hypothetical protein
MAARERTYFKVYYFLYRQYLKFSRPEKIIMVNAYINMPVVAAAKDLGIQVVEMQHGIITRYHLGYSYPHGQAIDNYMPDEISIYGQFFADETQFAPSVEINITGMPYLQEILGRYADYPKNKGQVLIASQGPSAEKLLSLSVGLAKKRPDLNVVFRLHPSDLLKDYIARDPKLPNFRLSCRHMDHEPSTYELMAQSEYQMSVCSTTLLEGVQLGCKTIILEGVGSEYMNGMIERGDAIYVQDLDELLKNMDKAVIKNDGSYYYALMERDNNDQFEKQNKRYA